VTDPIAPFGELEFRMATAADLSAVGVLLDANGLPGADVAEHIDHFLLAWHGPALVGVTGVEPHGETGLLRSVCVASEYRRRGLGRLLCRQIEAYARNLGTRRLFLLTTTSSGYFANLGYHVHARDTAPEALRRSTQFQSLCPASAICMAKSLGEGALFLPPHLLPLRADVPGARMWAVALRQAMLTYFEVEPHARFDRHAHTGEQITTVVEGELFFELDDEVVCVTAGASIAIPPGVPHAVYTRSVGARAFDAWSPPPPRYAGDTSKE
jgi:amino-acid N-acetyltransferase